MNRQNYPNRQRGDGKLIFGLIIAVAGILFLLDELHVLDSFDYVFNGGWPLGLIALGIFLGIRNKWSTNAPYILIAIGVFNLIPVFHINGVSSKDLVFPAALVVFGLYIAFRKKKNNWSDSKRLEMVTNGESMLNIDVTMGGRKEIVTSKEFRGGKISTTFGGVEVNLMQADSSIQPMVLDIKVAFGSVEMIVPSHWEVINEIRPSMGSVEDHRSGRMPENTTDKKTLYLRGSCSFGSVEVKSY